MGILASLLEVRAHTPDPNDEFWWTPDPGARASSGVMVSADSALRTSPVWACVRLIAESIAALPIIVYQRLDDGGKERAYNHPLYDVLHDQPNAFQTAFSFKRTLMVHALLWGNGYARLIPGKRGPVDQLVPLPPDSVRVEQFPVGQIAGVRLRGIRYRITHKDGQEEIVDDGDIFHLPGLSVDGISGLSLIRYARESIGLSLAAHSYSARTFSQNARPGGVLKHPGKLSEQAARRLRADWQALHAGLENAHKVAVLEEGMDWVQTGMTNEDAQLIAQLDWSVADIARFFNVPLHMIQQMTKSTSWGSGIEEMSIEFVVHTLLPWIRNWEDTIRKDLIVANRTYFAEFLLDGLLRGKLKDRYDAYAVGRQWGWLSVNDIRRLENLNPIPNGDVYLQPLNMVEAGQASPAMPGGGSSPSTNTSLLRDETATPKRATGTKSLLLSGGHYLLLLHEAAGRVVRKEIVALSRAAKRCADDAEAWAQSVEEFYADHADFVSRTLRIPRAVAERYVAEQRKALLSQGAAAMEDWEIQRVGELVALALGGRDAATQAGAE